MATIASLLVSIETNMAQFTTDMNKMSSTVDSAMNKMTGAVRGFQNVLAGVAVGAMFHEMIAASAEAELSMKKVEQVIKSTGGIAGVTANQVSQISTALQKQTGASDDALNSAQALLLTFTKVGRDVFPDAVSVINDMSKALGQDLQSSTIQLGKALNDPIKGVTALQRVGVSFTAAQKEQIKALVESGRALDAQKLILSELQTEFGGAAAAARDTLGGAFDALKNQTGELFEALGGGGNNGGLRYIVELCLAAMENLTDGVGDLQKWFGSSQDSAVQFKSGLETVLDVLGGVWESFKLGTNVIIGWYDTVLNQVLPGVLKGLGEFAEMAYDALVRKPTGGLSDLVLNFTGTFTKSLIEGIPAGIKQGSALMEKEGKDYIGNFANPIMEGIGGLQKQVEERMKLISAAAGKAKIHLPSDLGEGGDGPSKKEHEAASRHFAQQLNGINSIVSGYQKMSEELDGKLRKEEMEVKLMQDIVKINSADMIGTMEKTAAISMITAEYEKQKKTKAAMAADKEAEDLKGLLANLKEKSAEMEAQLKGQTGITEAMKIEAELQKILKDAKGEHLDLVEQIRKEEERIVQIDQEKKRQEELKSVKEITDSYQDQILALDAKVRGYDDSLDLIKQERKIMEEMKNLSPEDKANAINQIEQLHQRTKDYNNVLKSQEDLISDIMGSNSGYYNQMKDLEQALQSGQINLKQYDETMSKLNKSQKSVSESGKQFGSTITKGLQDMIFEGKKATDVFKNMGKELLKSFTQRAIFNPLQEKLGLAFDAAGRNLFGLGKTPGVGGAGNQPPWGSGFTTPWMPQPGFANSGGSTGGWGMLNAPLSTVPAPTMSFGNGSSSSSGPIYHTGPIYVNGGQIAMSGGTTGMTGGGTGLGGGLGGLVNTILNPIRSLMNGIGSSLSDLLSGVSGIFSSLTGGLSSLLGGLGGIFKGGIGNILGGGLSLLSKGSFGVGNLLSNIPIVGNLLGGGFGAFSGLTGALGFKASGGNYSGALPSIFDALGIPAFAQGGRPTPHQPSLIGDGGNGSGTELWWPDSSGTIIPQNQAIDLLAAFAGTRSGLFGKSQDQDYNGIINNFNGTPLYQQDPNFRPNLPPDIQREIEKNEAWKAAQFGDGSAKAAYWGQYGEMPNMSKVVAFYNTLPEDLNPEMQDWFRDSVKMNAEARLARNPLDNFASDTLANKTFTSVMASQKYGNFALPAGDQMSRMLMNWTHRGVNPSTRLMEYAMNRDYLSGIINPTGSWQGSSFSYNSSGMTWGAGAGGAVNTGNGPGQNQWTGEAPAMILTPTGWASLRNPNGPGPARQSDFAPQWGQPNSGLPSWMQPNPSPSSNPGKGPNLGDNKGLGGLAGDWKNLIAPNNKQWGETFAETGGLIERIMRFAQGSGNGFAYTNEPPDMPNYSNPNPFNLPEGYTPEDGTIAGQQAAGRARAAQHGFPMGRKSGGGIDAMNMYEVGENGREFIFSGSRGQVVSNAAAEAALKGGGAPQIQVINQTRGTVAQPDVQISPEGVARIVLREIQQAVGGRTPGRRGS